MRAIAAILCLVLLTGCATYEAKNRILMCFGFCALQGIEAIREDGSIAIVPPVEKCMAPKQEE